ncbi:MAG: hypothetical protein NVS4B7_02410 [Ktedonobacteraceae bacterium]
MGLYNNKDNDELSDIWRKLLGAYSTDTTGVQAYTDQPVPPLSLNDPWSELLHTQDVKIVDLQHLRLPDIQISLSEIEVEQALQIMQEQPDSH